MSSNRIPIAVVVNAPSPYRVALHRRVAREIPEIRLTTCFLHEQNLMDWRNDALDDIGAIQFGPGERLITSYTPARVWSEWQKGGRICEALATRGVRAIVASGYSSPALVRVLVWARSEGVPTLLSADSNSRADTARGWRRLVKNIYVRAVVLLVRGVLVQGTRGREYYTRYGADPSRVYYWPYEPDIRRIESLSASDVSSVMRTHGLGAGRRHILCSGRDDPVKAWEVGLAAFERVADARAEWDLVFAGDEQFRRTLLPSVRADLRGRVKCLGFIGDQRELAGLYRGCDVLLHPARKEAWSVVIHEGVAAGMAVVSSDVPGATPELVRDGVNGRVCPPDDVGALTECLMDATDPARLASMRAASPGVLREWSRTYDPICGMRGALAMLGVLPAQPDAR